MRRRRWDRLASGLYVPPFIGRLLPRVPMMGFAGYPCCCEEESSSSSSSPSSSSSSSPSSSSSSDSSSESSSWQSGNDCTHCTGITPLRFSVTIAGVVNCPDDPCATCANINGTYILTQLANPCQWQFDWDPKPCTDQPDWINFQVFDDADAGVIGNFGPAFPLSYAAFQRNRAGGGTDCVEISGDIPKIDNADCGEFQFPKTTKCDYSAATFVVNGPV